MNRSREEGGGGSEGEGSGQWIVLDGPLSSHQLETLLNLLDTNSRSINLSNGRSIPVNSSYRFILELPSLESLTPHSSVCLPRLCLSSSTISWFDPVSHWLLSQPRDRAAVLEPLLRRLLPPCLEFLAPLLVRGDAGDRERGLSVPSQSSTGSLGEGPQLRLRLTPQELRLHPAHLVTSCCTVLQVGTAGTLFSAVYIPNNSHI